MKIQIAALVAILPLSLGCGMEPDPVPYAVQVAQSIAKKDFTAYQALALDRSQAMQGDSNPTATKGTFSALAPLESGRVRQQFDRAVRLGVVHAGESYSAVVTATEPDRWTVEVTDSQGRQVGLQMVLRRYDDSFRLVHLHAY